jgi:hypothetical protein
LVHYRPFLNTDPPGLAEVWNDALTGRGAAYVGSPNLFEHCLFAKPWFDPAGLIVAHDASGRRLRPRGFGDDAGCPVRDRGLTRAVTVRPVRRQSRLELLRRCGSICARRARTYFGRGAFNPFGFGIYGGSNSPGVLDGEPEAGPFGRHGYAPMRPPSGSSVDGAINVADAASGLREYEFRARPRASVSSWWREGTRTPSAGDSVWKRPSKFAASGGVEMEPFRTWSRRPTGLELEVR